MAIFFLNTSILIVAKSFLENEEENWWRERRRGKKKKKEERERRENIGFRNNIVKVRLSGMLGVKKVRQRQGRTHKNMDRESEVLIP